MVSLYNKEVKFRTAVFFTLLAIVISSFAVARLAHAANFAQQLDSSTVSPNVTNGLGNMVSIGTGYSGSCGGMSIIGQSATGQTAVLALYSSVSPQTTYNGSINFVEQENYTFTTNGTETAAAPFTCSLNPSLYYYVEVYVFGSSAKLYGAATNTTSYGIITNNPTNQSGLGIPYFLFGADYTPPTDLSTHIVYTNPLNAATTTIDTQTIGAHVYVNPADYTPGMYLNIALTNQTITVLGGGALDAWNAATGNNGIQIPITSSGSSDISTTTFLTATGTVQASWSIRSPTFFSSLPLGLGVLFSPNTLYATSTTFIIGTTTPLDIALANSGQGVANYLLTGTTTPILDFSGCSIGASFSFTGCLLNLIVPDQAAINLDLQQARSGIATRAPWGYVYRLVTIFTASTTGTALPTFTANVVVGGSNGTSTESLTFNPGDMLAGGATLLNTVTASNGENLQQITEPWVQLFVALTILIIIWHDIMAMGHHKKSVSGSVGK
jgi:hypothetical protein